MNNFYVTTDLGLAACLLTVGYPLDSFDRSDKKRVSFIFKRDERMDKILQQYFSRLLRIEPISFFLNQKSLKSYLYQD